MAELFRGYRVRGSEMRRERKRVTKHRSRSLKSLDFSDVTGTSHTCMGITFSMAWLCKRDPELMVFCHAATLLSRLLYAPRPVAAQIRELCVASSGRPLASNL